MALLRMTFANPVAAYLDQAIADSGLAHRPDSLDGKVVGLLPNWRPAAVNILKAVGDMLGQRYRLQAVFMEEPLREPPSKTGKLLDAVCEELDDFARRVDVAIAATGD